MKIFILVTVAIGILDLVEGKQLFTCSYYEPKKFKGDSWLPLVSVHSDMNIILLQKLFQKFGETMSYNIKSLSCVES